MSLASEEDMENLSLEAQLAFGGLGIFALVLLARSQLVTLIDSALKVVLPRWEVSTIFAIIALVSAVALLAR